MKNIGKLALIVTLIISGTMTLIAQEETKKDRILQKFSLTPQVGLLHSWSDFNDEGFGGFLDQNELGVGLLLNYRLNKFISISTGGLYGQLSGTQDEINTNNAKIPANLGLGILFQTDLFEFTLPRVDVNVSRLIFKDKSKLFNKLSVNLIGSHGLVFSDAKIYAQQDEGVNLNYRNETSPSDVRGSSNKTTEAVTSYGMGLSYIINDRFDIGVESTIRNVWNDKLDAWESDGTANDKYSFTAIGVTYHLKKRKDVVKTFKPDVPEAIAEETKVEEEKKEEEVAEVKEKIEEQVEEVAPEVEEKKEEIVEKVEEVTPEVTEKVAEKKEEVTPVKEKKVVPSTNTSGEVDVYEGGGNFIAVAAFRGLQGSKRMSDQLKAKGENPVVIRNKKNTWYIITIARYDDKEEALGKMREAREKGYERAWVHIK